jgi:dipeptidyl aminopeptidase/acylaminoacyl peptidase
VIQGKYYQYDVAEDKIKFLFDLVPQLKKRIWRVCSLTFKSGLTIHGYITKRGLKWQKVPLIVVPHGGPQG